MNKKMIGTLASAVTVAISVLPVMAATESPNGWHYPGWDIVTANGATANGATPNGWHYPGWDVVTAHPHGLVRRTGAHVAHAHTRLSSRR